MTTLSHLVDYLLNAVIALARAWVASSILLVAALIVMYWWIPRWVFTALPSRVGRREGAVHFVVFGVAVAIADIGSAAVMVTSLSELGSVDTEMILRLMWGAVVTNVVTWSLFGLCVGRWLAKRRYSLAMNEAFGFALLGLVAARLSGLLEVLTTEMVFSRPLVSHLHRLNLAYLGPNFLTLVVAFAVHRAGIRHMFSPPSETDSVSPGE